MLICAHCGQHNPPAARYCNGCAASLATTADRVEVRKTVTVLFCDIAGSTALGESTDPEVLHALLARYFERMKAIVESHGGTVEKFIGDAVMAVFGIPAAHEDDALRACRAAAEMRHALPALGIHGRIGVNTGEVVTATLNRLAAGDAVNVAARLEQAAASGEVLIGQATHALARDAIEVEPVEPLTLKGRSQPVQAFRLVSVRDAPERSHRSRFVGRERELAQILEASKRSQTHSRCELLTVVGEAGMGKSRLVAEAVALLDARAVRGRCLPYGEGITYWPVVEVIQQLDALPTEPVARAIICSLLGDGQATTTAEEIAWAFRKLLEEQAPLVVVFDDLHWGQETFLDLIEHVALLSAGSPLLLVCMARSELSERRARWPVSLKLEPLAPCEVEALLPSTVAAGLRTQIARAAGGNPLFVTEMLAMSAGSESPVVVPPTLKALLAARLDQLEAPVRRVLERGAVEGELFHRGAVQALAPEETQVTPRLATLVRQALIRPDRPQLPGEDGFRFCHLLIRDAAYDSLPKTLRAELHERFAHWLGATNAARELGEIVGYHLYTARRTRLDLDPADERAQSLAVEAIPWLRGAAQRAVAQQDSPAAARILDRTLELLRPDDPQRPELLIALGEALRDSGRLAEAERRLEEAELHATAAELTVLAKHAALDRAMVAWYTRPSDGVDALVRAAEELIPIAGQIHDDALLAHAWTMLGYARWVRCEIGPMLAALEHARPAAQRASRSARGHVRRLQARAATYGPTPVDEAQLLCRELVQEARAERDRSGEAAMEAMLAYLDSLTGRFDAARARHAVAGPVLEELGDRLGLAVQRWFAGRVELLAGAPAAAEAYFRDGLAFQETLGDQGGNLAPFLVFLGAALHIQDKDDEATNAVETAARIANRADVEVQVVGRSTLAEIRARTGQAADAGTLAWSAVAIAERTDAPILRADALRSLAVVLRDTGLRRESKDVARRAVALYEAKGSTVGAAAAAALA